MGRLSKHRKRKNVSLKVKDDFERFNLPPDERTEKLPRVDIALSLSLSLSLYYIFNISIHFIWRHMRHERMHLFLIKSFPVLQENAA